MAEKIYYYFLLFLGLVSISGALFYKLFNLGNAGVILSLILAFIFFVIIQLIEKKFKNTLSGNNDIAGKKIFIDNYYKKRQSIKKSRLFWLFIYLLLFSAAILSLAASCSSEALVSPWQAASPVFFVLFFLSTLALIVNICKNPGTFFLLPFHFFLCFSVAAIIYRLGFGFDPFVHGATLDHIDKFGQALPKPFYYLGYYALLIIIHKTLYLPLNILNVWIVPVLASLLLPATIYIAGKDWLKGGKYLLLSALSLLILPFSPFIISTPQNLAYLFLLIVSFFALKMKNERYFLLSLILSLAAISYQPIAGVTAFLFTLFAFLSTKNFNFKRIILLILLAANTFFLPLAFFYINSLKSASAGFNGPFDLSFLLSFFSLTPASRENAVLNLAYFYIFNFKFIFMALLAAFLIIFKKYKKNCSVLYPNLLFSFTLLLSYIISSGQSFDFLINYERSNYNTRILIMAMMMLIPAVFASWHAFYYKLKNENKFIRSASLSFLALFLLISLYMSYPRLDDYFNSRGHSVSMNDIQAVSWINENAGEKFIVLANQQVSAAALSLFGFKTYYEGADGKKIFYYPIPTGSELYRHYLDMVYDKPSRRHALEAMELAGVDKAYFVLNGYWWAFDKILNEAKLEADSYESFGNGEIFVFEYKK